jgi:hypothetical protein
MAQNHCLLPWMANLQQFSDPLAQHLQGVMVHGRALTMYRTFHTISNGANLQIHTLLLTLEEIWTRDAQQLPDTIYIQVDGGVENVAKAVFMMCELIVIRRLTRKIVLTRLPVGHTHCDIDGNFGRLWVHTRNTHMLTPERYAIAVEKALSTPKYTAKIKDIFVVPDYNNFFDGCLDKLFGSYCKKDSTQLQFVFEAVTVSNSFPLGVKTTYKAYSAEEVVEIREINQQQQQLIVGGGEEEVCINNSNEEYYLKLQIDHHRSALLMILCYHYYCCYYIAVLCCYYYYYYYHYYYSTGGDADI